MQLRNLAHIEGDLAFYAERFYKSSSNLGCLVEKKRRERLMRRKPCQRLRNFEALQSSETLSPNKARLYLPWKERPCTPVCHQCLRIATLTLLLLWAAKVGQNRQRRRKCLFGVLSLPYLIGNFWHCAFMEVASGTCYGVSISLSCIGGLERRFGTNTKSCSCRVNRSMGVSWESTCIWILYPAWRFELSFPQKHWKLGKTKSANAVHRNCTFEELS